MLEAEFIWLPLVMNGTPIKKWAFVIIFIFLKLHFMNVPFTYKRDLLPHPYACSPVLLQFLMVSLCKIMVCLTLSDGNLLLVITTFVGSTTNYSPTAFSSELLVIFFEMEKFEKNYTKMSNQEPKRSYTRACVLRVGVLFASTPRILDL